MTYNLYSSLIRPKCAFLESTISQMLFRFQARLRRCVYYYRKDHLDQLEQYLRESKKNEKEPFNLALRDIEVSLSPRTTDVQVHTRLTCFPIGTDQLLRSAGTMLLWCRRWCSKHRRCWPSYGCLTISETGLRLTRLPLPNRHQTKTTAQSQD